jgi:hypothetical protein
MYHEKPLLSLVCNALFIAVGSLPIANYELRGSPARGVKCITVCKRSAAYGYQDTELHLASQR